MERIVVYAKFLAILGAALFVLDRVLLALELRGIIAYRRYGLSPGSVGNALLGVHGLLEPAKRYAVEQQMAAETHREQDDEGGPDQAGGKGKGDRAGA